MRSLSILLVPALLLAALPPAAGDANYTEQNMAYILELAGYAAMPDEIVEVELDGQPVLMPAQDAVRLAAELHARTDLRNVGEHSMRGVAAVIDVGFFARDCQRAAAPQVPNPLFMPPFYQMWLYWGHVDNLLLCGETLTTEWATKQFQFFDAYPGTIVAGNGIVITFWGMTFGSINGAIVRAAP